MISWPIQEERRRDGLFLQEDFLLRGSLLFPQNRFDRAKKSNADHMRNFLFKYKYAGCISNLFNEYVFRKEHNGRFWNQHEIEFFNTEIDFC